MLETEKDPELLNKARDLSIKIRGSNKVCKLKKALYGLRQAGRQWHAELDKALRGVGMNPTNADPCVYVDHEKMNFVLIYVDDILIFFNDPERETEIKEGLRRSFKTKDLGAAKLFLGIEMRRVDGNIHICQKGYIREILKRFEMMDCNLSVLQ